MFIWAAVVEVERLPTESNVAIYVAAISGVVAVVVAWIARGRFKSMEAGNALDHGAVVEQVLELHTDFRAMMTSLMDHISREDDFERAIMNEITDIRQIRKDLHEHIAGMEDRRLVAIQDVEQVLDRALEPWRKLAAENGWDGVERRHIDGQSRT